MDQEKKKPLVSDAGAWGMNVVSSVGIIMVNKFLMSTVGYGFRYDFKIEYYACGLCVGVDFHSKRYSSRVIMAVVIVGLGVGIYTVTDVQINGKGFLCTCVAVLCTSLQQITIGSFQKKYSIESFEQDSTSSGILSFGIWSICRLLPQRKQHLNLPILLLCCLLHRVFV
ncbi:hypothetical protein ZOSMA_407G00010 [Zostera marina]|uniref:Uncharacterized protein n=1 Tax=Zostera marina TaxID=29655 RepID=A0A0K9P3B9_ZOSMR|nr:hypothetical protein ZOSMA_407G00010 [Zostera marina]